MNEIGFQYPSGYSAFEELVICSNVLIGGGIPIRIKDNVPLLVGKGEVPIIWLFATKDGKEWYPVVRENSPLSENYSVNVPKEGKSVLVLGGNAIILHAVKLLETKVEIDSLDLRPLGLDFHGNKAGLHIGNNLFTGNIFQGVAAMIDIG